ncbi:hypothetical protein AMJ85_10495 [candidate division BRC1 bacterium SM23_51]|nr:MAG: hypothetical protein AMJ85_10495 [candidate division BRC1 bacterium SM23_51]
MPSFSLDVDAVSGGKNPYAVPTFECVGVYYKSPDCGECKLHYRKQESGKWRQGLSLVYDPRNGEYRGSLVGLEPDTPYVIRLECGDRREELVTRTRSELFPVGKTTYLDDGSTDKIIHITESGTDDAYHLVTPREGAKTTIDVRNTQDYTAVIDADYVILRGVELKNAAIHGILVKKGRHDIVIEDCRITFWGRSGGPRTFGNVGGSDSAIYAERGAGNLVIQRNLIEHPRGASNDWETGHPSGPQGISLINSSGGNIIRYNEIRSTEDHGYNDAIGGAENFSAEGSPNRDSDIYSNIIRNVWDDAIESEGANMNVRIWGNYIDLTFQFVATASTYKGPLYIFRNIWHRSRRTHRNPIGGSMIKTGGRYEFRGGRRYIFHNTALQPSGALNVIGNRAVPNCVTRNNVFDCPGRFVSSRLVTPPSDFDYDFYSGMDKGIPQEEHGVSLRWNQGGFVESYSLEFYPSPTVTVTKWGKIPIEFAGKEKIITDPVVTVPNPIIDAGAVIPGFNDDYAGKAPDLGAFELGRPPLRFGRRAGGTVWAPWELR